MPPCGRLSAEKRGGMKHVMTLGLLAAIVGGCGSTSSITPSDRMSPRTLAVATHHAIETRNTDAMVDLVAPPYRKSMRAVLVSVEDYARESDKTATLLAQHVSQASADRLRNETADFYRQLLPSPLHPAARGDHIDWTRINLREENGGIWTYVDGQKSPFHKTFVFLFQDGAWYVEPLDMPQQFAANAKRLAANYRSAIKTLQKIQAEIRSGTVAEADINLRLWPPRQ